MPNKTKHNPSSFYEQFPFIPLAFLICFLYWMYIACIAQMVIADDSIGYERLGYLLNEKGWHEYWRTGPFREPFYPFLVSLSVGLSQNLHLSYQTIQLFIQLFILFITQCLMLNILKKLRIHPLLCAFSILYLGISPAIINSTVILYSEIASYPFVLSLIILNVHLWKLLTRPVLESRFHQKKIMLYALGLGLNFTLATFARAIFESMTPFLLLPYFILPSIQKNPVQRKNTLMAILVCLMAFYVPVVSYKLMNKKYNNHFTLMEHGSKALYGQTARRMQELTPRRFMAALAFVPNWRFCLNFFSDQECRDWSFIPSDDFGVKKKSELEKSLTPTKVDLALIRFSAHEALQNPWQYMLLMGVESLKMFFWEEATSQYVIFPKNIIKVYSFKPFSVGLKWLSALLTFMSLIYLGIVNWRNRKDILSGASREGPTFILFYIFILICFFIFVHSFFYILPRYILPIVSLYLIAFAHLLQSVFFKTK